MTAFRKEYDWGKKSMRWMSRRKARDVAAGVSIMRARAFAQKREVVGDTASSVTSFGTKKLM